MVEWSTLDVFLSSWRKSVTSLVLSGEQKRDTKLDGLVKRIMPSLPAVNRIFSRHIPTSLPAGSSSHTDADGLQHHLS